MGEYTVIHELERKLESARSTVAELVLRLVKEGIEAASETDGLHAAIVLKEHGYPENALRIFQHLFQAGSRTDQLLFEYIQLLRRLDQNDEAERILLDAIIAEDVCGDNLAREVIVTALAQKPVGTAQRDRLLSALALVLTRPGMRYMAEVGNYLARESVVRALEALDGLPRLPIEQVGARLSEAVMRREPFCMLRLGDGEGPFLRSGSMLAANALLFDQHRAFFTERWFGDPQLAQDDTFLQVGRELQCRLGEVDIIGIPDATWLRHEVKFRNLRTIVNCLEVQKSAVQLASETECYFTTTSAALDLEYRGLLEGVMRSAERLVLVTSHPTLADAVRRRYGVKVASVIAIPPAGSDLQITGYQPAERHFKDAFERVRSELRAVQPGTLVLVAAGFLGKIYSLDAKRNGCVSIDIGSLADLWMGFMTRPGFHALPFLRLDAPKAA